MADFGHNEIASFVVSQGDKGYYSYEQYHVDSSIDMRTANLLGARIQKALSSKAVVESLGTGIRNTNASDEHISLACEFTDGEKQKQFYDVLFARKSERVFSKTPLPKEKLLKFVVSLLSPHVSRFHRAYPSAGACFANEILINCRNVDGVKPGLYGIDFDTNSLVKIEDLLDTVTLDAHEPDVAATFIFVSLFPRVTYKYGSRGYRFALLEAGSITQIVEMTAQVLECSAVSSGGYLDWEILDYAGFPFPQAGVTGVVHVGVKMEEE